MFHCEFTRTEQKITAKSEAAKLIVAQRSTDAGVENRFYISSLFIPPRNWGNFYVHF